MKKLTIIIIIFLIVGGYLIYRYGNFNLEEKEGKKEFAKNYAGWLWQVGKNVKDTVGYAMEKKWLPKNETNQTVNKS